MIIPFQNMQDFNKRVSTIDLSNYDVYAIKENNWILLRKKKTSDRDSYLFKARKEEDYKKILELFKDYDIFNADPLMREDGAILIV
jgi:hypothetical protein